MRRLVFPLLGLALAAACSGGSGVDGKLAINSLQQSDWTRYCNWYNAQVADSVGKSCPGGGLIPNIQISDCTTKNISGTCPATVSQVEDCVGKFKDHVCDGITKVAPTCNNFPPNCYALFAGSNATN